MNMVKALVAALVLVGSVSHAQKVTKKDLSNNKGYGIAGCGLGSMVFGDKTGPLQIVSSTLNGVMGTQTFGITSGTSNCGTGDSYADTKTFIDNNAVALENDVVRGQGEALGTLSKIMKCNESVLSVTLKNNYKEIYSSKETSAQKVLDTAAKVCSAQG